MLQKIKFKYSGRDIDAILDKLLTAKVLNEEDGVYMMSAETFGQGVDMWLRSQGDMMEILWNERLQKRVSNYAV